MIVISGYFGFDNWGDEAILAATLAKLAGLGVQSPDIVVLSGAPQQTERLHSVPALNRHNLRGVISALRRADLLICGGGSLLQDVSSCRSVPYYLGIVEMAYALSCPVVFLAQGIGPLHRHLYRRWAASAVNRSRGATLRDQTSLQQLLAWGVARRQISVSSDMVFGWPEAKVKREKVAGISLNIRPYRQWPQHRLLWIELIRTWLDKGWPLEFVALGPGDAQIGASLSAAVPALTVRIPASLIDAIGSMQRRQIAVSMRLHGLIFAAVGESLPIGLNYDPKVSALGAQLAMPVHPAGPAPELTELIKDLSDRHNHWRTSLQQQVALLREKDKTNQELLEKVLSYGGC